MNASQIVGKFGSVVIDTINDKEERQSMTFNLAPLSVGEELVLDSELKALCEAERGTKRDKQLAEVGASDGTWAHRQFIQELVRYVMEPVTMFDVSQRRYSLDGIRVELWHRAKKTQPKLERGQVEACVTVANMLSVRNQIDEAINPEKKSGTKSKPVSDDGPVDKGE